MAKAAKVNGVSTFVTVSIVLKCDRNMLKKEKQCERYGGQPGKEARGIVYSCRL